MKDTEMRAMLIEYMGNGFLENIISLLIQDSSLYRFIPDLLGDESIRVRLGATALVEELVADHREELKVAVPGVIGLLKNGNPAIRGDAASVLGIIRDAMAIEALQICLHDDHPGVRTIAGDALAEIGG